MDDAKRIVIERWLAKARNDLVTAQTMFKNDPPVTDTACFHAQRCAEKMLKAFLAFQDIHVERTHDLARYSAGRGRYCRCLGRKIRP